jgi:nucleoside-diphosphate-sugar epimerase
MRLRDGRAVPAFMAQALNNEDVTVFGDGTQTRSFCYVTDLVDGIIRLLESDQHGPINIGNPSEMTIEEIARAILRLTGSSARPARSSTVHSPWTIRSSGAPTSRARARCLAGNRRSDSRKACSRPWPFSRHECEHLRFVICEL